MQLTGLEMPAPWGGHFPCNMFFLILSRRSAKMFERALSPFPEALGIYHQRVGLPEAGLKR